VPISTRVAYPENRSRTLFKTLYAGPIEALGLLSGPTIPYASRIYISNGVASIYIYSPEQTGYEDHFERVTESITNSMTSLSFITSVKFYIDNKNDTPFGNVDLQADYAPTKTNVAYLNYSLDSEYSMMLPLPLDSFEATGDTVYNRILAALKGALSYTDGEHIEGISPSLPAQLTLLNTSLSDTSLLTLNFSSECLGCLDSLDAEIASAAAQRAVDSIVYSYCSLEDVSAVQILIDGQSVSDFYGVDLSEPLQPALYINMDPSIS
jgi:spore germination protein GerM